MEFFRNKYAKVVIAILVVLLVILGIAMVSSVESTPEDEPGTGQRDLPAVVRAAMPAAGVPAAPVRVAVG